ncbi:hypothetical protein D3C77_817130 [compost metagenome]
MAGIGQLPLLHRLVQPVAADLFIAVAELRTSDVMGKVTARRGLGLPLESIDKHKDSEQ